MALKALEGVRRKLDRAEEHLDAIEEATEGFMDRQPCRAVVQAHSETRECSLNVQVSEWPHVLDWGVLIGDVVHNMRSGLDHLAWVVGGNPPPNQGSAFPIFKDKGQFLTQGCPLVAGADEPIKRIIEDVQPYQRGPHAEADALWRLYELSNRDKHRLLVVSSMGSWGGTFWNQAPHARAIETILTAALLRPITEDGQELVRWTWPPGTPQLEANKDFHLDFYVSLDPEGPAGGRPVHDELRRIQHRIESSVYEPIAALY